MTATERADRRAFADRLIERISRLYFHAYFSHANGMSLDELLIEHDIEAAGVGVDEHLAETGRRTIRAAVKAVDTRLPYHPSHDFLIGKIRGTVERLFKAKTKAEQRAVIDALDTNIEA